MSALLTIVDARAQRGGWLVLDGVGVSVTAGEMVGVVGPNGAGKTTLLRVAAGLQPLVGGSVLLGDRDPRRTPPQDLARRVGYLPQERRLAWNLPAWRAASLGALSEPPLRAEALARAALAKVGLEALADRGVFDMSGGERARVLLARLLTVRAPLLLADEPTAGLDPDAQLMILDLLRAEASAGGGVLLSLHDLGLAARSCDRLVVLHRGVVAAEGAPAKALSRQVLAEVFGLDGGLAESPAGPVLVARRLPGAAA